MNAEKILASFSVEFSEKEGMAYTCDQMIHLLIRAKQKGEKLILPANCSPEQIEKFAKFVSEYSKAFTGTVKGLDTNWFTGQSLMTQDKKELFLFSFASCDTSLMVKGIKNKKKNITLLPDNRPVTLGNSIGLGEGPGSLWIFLKKGELNPMCTVISIKLDEPIDLYASVGAPITQN